MKVRILERQDAPETQLYVKIVKRSQDKQKSWDRDVMILIPGGPGGNHTLYADIEDQLLCFADLVIIDLRGCGLSDKSDVEFCTLDHHIRDIEAVRKALSITRPVIHGCSYGAIVAVGFGINYPENLSRLILSSGSVSGSFIESAQKNLVARGTPEQIEAGKLVWEGRFKNPEQFSEYYKIMAPLYVYDHQMSDSLPALKNNIPYNTDLVNYAFKTFLRNFDYSFLLQKVQIPTLIISGRNDWITDSEQAEKLHAGIANSSLVLFDRCGHFPWKDQKELFLTTLKNFLG
jgi:proline iminopeptidase